MAVGSFNQRITLEGAEQIQRQLQQLGDQARQSFAGARGAIEGLSPGLQRFVARIAEMRGAFGGFAGTVSQVLGPLARFSGMLGVGSGGVALSAGGIVGGLFAVVKSGSSATSQIGKLARASGSSVEEMGGMVDALAQVGVETDTLQSAFNRLAVRIQSEWPQIRQEVADSALRMQEAHLGVINSIQRLIQANRNLAQVDADATRQSINNTNAVESAKQGLLEAQIRLFEAQTGERIEPELRQQLDIQKAQLAVEQARAQLEEAEDRKERERQDAEQKRADAALQRRVAELAVAKAEREEQQLKANDLTKIARVVDLVAAGFNVTTRGLNLSADNLAKGLILAAGQGVQGLGQLEGGLVSLAGQEPNLRTTIFKVADFFKGLNNEALKTAISVQLFGREAGPKLARALSLGSQFLREEEQRLRALGLSVNAQDVATARAFRRSQVQLENSAEAIQRKLAAVFGPPFTRLMENYRRQLELSTPALLRFAQQVATVIDPATSGIKKLTAAYEVLKTTVGTRGIIANPFLAAAPAAQGAAAAGASLGSKGGFEGFIKGAEKVFLEIGDAAGAAWSGISEGFLSLLSKLSSGWDSIVSLGSAAWESIKGVASDAWESIKAFFTPEGLSAFWEGVKQAASDAWEQVKQSASDAWENIKFTFSPEGLSEFWNSIKNAASQTWTNVKQAASESFDAIVEFTRTLPGRIASAIIGLPNIIRNALTPGSGGAGQVGGGGNAGSGGGFASGGFIRGPGTATSDSILARLSRGEFVINAAAVRHYGLGRIAALNNMMLPRFAFGGLVESIGNSIPGLAAGGSAPVLGTIILQAGGQSFRVSADEGTAKSLIRYAAGAQIRRAGHKPVWA